MADNETMQLVPDRFDGAERHISECFHDVNESLKVITDDLKDIKKDIKMDRMWRWIQVVSILGAIGLTYLFGE